MISEGETSVLGPGRGQGTPSVPDAVPWTVLDGLVILLGLMALQVLLGFCMGAGGLAGQLRIAAISSALALIAVAGLVRFCAGRGVPVLGAIGLGRPGRLPLGRAWKALAAGAVAYVATAFAVVAAVRCLGVDWQEVPPQPLLRMIARAQSARLLMGAGFVAVLMAPLSEEVIFRSVLYLPLRSRVGAVPAALIVAAVFSAVHGYPWGAAQLVVLSLALSALFEVTGTLWAPIAAHALFNGVALLLARALESGPHLYGANL